MSVMMDKYLKLRLELLIELTSELESLRPIPSHSEASLRNKIALEWTYHSNALEGGVMSIREAKVVLEGIAVGGRSLKEHLEIINHNQAIEWLESKQAKSEAFSEAAIRKLNQNVLRGINDEQAGRYRSEYLVVSGAPHSSSEPIQAPEEINRLIEWYDSSEKTHLILRAADLHVRFSKIHPFMAGNSKTARLLMNLAIIKDGYLPAVIRKDERANYQESLQIALASGNLTKFQTMIVGASCRTTLTYLSLLQPGKYQKYLHD